MLSPIFFFNDTATTEIYTLSLHDALPISERTAGDTIHDASITMRIKTTYLFNGHLNPFRINVDTHDGVVTLHGTVPSDVHRDLAVEIAKNADGVREVQNELQLAPSGNDSPDEADKIF